MTVIARAECTHCGRPRTEYDELGFCLGVLTVAEHPPSQWTIVEYVPRSQVEGAVKERDEALRLLANATDPENEGDWQEAREVGWAWAESRIGGQ